MWDSRTEDPMWTRKLPFERDAFTYIEIIPSNLVAKLIGATANLVTRGKGQSIMMEPYLYSLDPDFPDDGFSGLEFRWFCRMMSSATQGESYPLDGDDRLYDPNDLIPIPIADVTVVNGTEGGCFGTGPGAINTTEGMLTLETAFFHNSDSQLYEILLEVRKDTSDYKPGYVRVSVKTLHLLVVPGVPPLMMILCADPALCFTDETGKTYVNPSSRLALKAWCSLDEGSDCTEPMTYQWKITLPNQEESLDKVLNYSSTGLQNSEVAISSAFFEEYPDEQVFFVGLTAYNGLNSMGKTLLYINLNQLPTGGQCNVEPLHGVSMVDSFYLSCDGWIDPEDIGIQLYLVSSMSNGFSYCALNIQKTT